MQLPSELLRWSELLRSMAMRDAPAPGDLLALLADIARSSRGGALNANQRRAALRLLAALCDDADAAQVLPRSLWACVSLLHRKCGAAIQTELLHVFPVACTKVHATPGSQCRRMQHKQAAAQGAFY